MPHSTYLPTPPPTASSSPSLSIAPPSPVDPAASFDLVQEVYPGDPYAAAAEDYTYVKDYGGRAGATQRRLGGRAPSALRGGGEGARGGDEIWRVFWIYHLKNWRFTYEMLTAGLNAQFRNYEKQNVDFWKIRGQSEKTVYYRRVFCNLAKYKQYI